MTAVEPSRSQRLNLIVAQGPEITTSDKPPHDFACRIESFKRLSNIISESGAETYETRSFKKGGYRWKLMMYPNGDTKNGGEGYVSLYLVLVDSPSFPVELKVSATLSFFLFNHTQLHYSVFQGNLFQDVNYHSGYGCHKFDKMKNGYGYPQLIPLSTFNDPSSGYLVDDSCVVGVNVNVKKVENFKMKAKLERLCNSGGSIVRTSFQFSQLDNEYYETEAFTAGGQDWVLRLYPGWINGYGNHLSLFLRLSRPKSLVGRVVGICFQGTAQQKVHAKFTLRVIDQLNGKHVERSVCGVFSDSNPSLGCSDFMEISQLRDQSCGYIQNDNLIAEVDFSDIIAN